MTLKVIIAEDEPGIMLMLENIISGIKGICVTGKANKIKDAYSLVLQKDADVILLDIHFPDGSGIDLAKRINTAEISIIIVFITVDPELSLEAFNLYAYDYILKPIDETRLIRTLTRLKEQKENQVLANKTIEKKHYITVKNGEEIKMVDQDTIYFFEITEKCIVVHCYYKQYEIPGTMNQLEPQLNSNFFRSHKAYIVNLKYIDKVVKWNRSIYQLCFYNTNKEAFLSRRKYKELIEKILHL